MNEKIVNIPRSYMDREWHERSKALKKIAEKLPAKQGIKCWCGNELVYRGNYKYWCDDPMCMGLYVMDQDCHIVAHGRVSKCKETLSSL